MLHLGGVPVCGNLAIYALCLLNRSLPRKLARALEALDPEFLGETWIVEDAAHAIADRIHVVGIDQDGGVAGDFRE
jgi:hypothetical protein